MACFFLVLVLTLLTPTLAIDATVYDNWWDINFFAVSYIPTDCYRFMGYLRCSENAKINPDARIELWESDDSDDGNDHQVTWPVGRNLTQGISADLPPLINVEVDDTQIIFGFYQCLNDGVIDFFVEPYYKFINICWNNDKIEKYGRAIPFPKGTPDFFMTRIFYPVWTFK